MTLVPNSLNELVRQAAERWPDRTCLVFDETSESITFAEVEARSNRIGNALLALGLLPGARVAVMLPNLADFPLSWLGIVKAGMIMTPINKACQESDARHALRLTSAEAIITTPDLAPLIEGIRKDLPALRHLVVTGTSGVSGLSLAEIAGAASSSPPGFHAYPETTANIQFTSGTTGMPKGCVLSHSYWLNVTRLIVEQIAQLTPQDTLLTAQAYSYIDPQWNTLVSLYSGATLVVLDRFSPSGFWEKVSRHHVTFFYCLGAMPTLMLAVPETKWERQHKLRLILCSGIPADRHREIEEPFGVHWVELYGSTDTGGDIHVPISMHDECAGTGTLGVAFPHKEIRVVDESMNVVARGAAGELLVRGTGMADGYYDDPEATTNAFRGGWFHTGDKVRQDPDGKVYFVTRTKDMIRRGGENIAAEEVEAAIAQHEAVKLVACLPVPDEIRGEEVKAVIVLSDEASASVGRDEAEKTTIVQSLLEHAQRHLARFKIPRYWEIRSELPMTPSLRVAKHLLQKEEPSPVYDASSNAWSGRGQRI